jgi:hypothetical protein
MTSFTKKLPYCTVYHCNNCWMSYGINNSFILVGFYMEDYHLCPDCYGLNELPTEDIVKIPLLDYNMPSPADSDNNGI